MSARIHEIHAKDEALLPPHLLPIGYATLTGPVRLTSVGLQQALADLRSAAEFAGSHQLNVLSLAIDRCGPYLVVVPHSRIYKLFGEECAWVQRKVDNGLRIETWLGKIGEVRVFWREVSACQ